MIQAQPGTLDRLTETLSSMNGVIDACRVIGPYDVVAVVEAEDLATLSSLLRRVLALAGIQSASTATTCDLSAKKEER